MGAGWGSWAEAGGWQVNRGRGILGSPKPLGGTEPGQHRPSRPALPPPGTRSCHPPSAWLAQPPQTPRTKPGSSARTSPCPASLPGEIYPPRPAVIRTDRPPLGGVLARPQRAWVSSEDMPWLGGTAHQPVPLPKGCRGSGPAWGSAVGGRILQRGTNFSPERRRPGEDGPSLVSSLPSARPRLPAAQPWAPNPLGLSPRLC